MRALLLLILIVLCLPPSTSFARRGDDTSNIYDLPNAVAIQPRRYEMKQSLLLSAGYMPTDSFNHDYNFTAAYRYGFASYLTWEVFSFTYVYNTETQLKHDIQNLGQSQGVQINVQNVGLGGVLDYPRQIYMTGLSYAPLYSKSLLFNSRLTYSESAVALYLGSLNFNQIGYKPFIAPGLNARYYISPTSAITGYFRDYFYKDDNVGWTGILDFGIGFEFKFGGDSSGRSDEARNQM